MKCAGFLNCIFKAIIEGVLECIRVLVKALCTHNRTFTVIHLLLLYIYFIFCWRNSLYVVVCHDKCLCYNLQISCLSKQALNVRMRS